LIRSDIAASGEAASGHARIDRTLTDATTSRLSGERFRKLMDFQPLPSVC
jgi:hypothetical protein